MLSGKYDDTSFSHSYLFRRHMINTVIMINSNTITAMTLYNMRLLLSVEVSVVPGDAVVIDGLLVVGGLFDLGGGVSVT